MTVPVPAAGVELVMPSDWQASHQDKTLTIVDPTGNAFISFTLIPGNKQALAQAETTFGKQLQRTLVDVKFGKLEPKKLNGLDIVLGEASGVLKAGKRPVKMGIVLVFTPKKSVLSCFAMVTADKESAFKERIVGVLASIRPLAATTKVPTANDAGNIPAAPTTLDTKPTGTTGKMSVTYAAPGDDVLVRKLVRAEGLFEKLVGRLNVAFKFPHDIPVLFDKCGMVNAFYDPRAVRITFCDEMTQFFMDQAKTWKGAVQERSARVLHAMAFFFLHELGHALIDQMHIPAVGREEDAADQVAAVLLISAGKEGEEVALDGATAFLSITSLHKGAPPQFADEHSLDEQRFYNITCLLYGANPTKYANLVKSEILPKARAARCPGEWTKISGAWKALLEPYVNH